MSFLLARPDNWPNHGIRRFFSDQDARIGCRITGNIHLWDDTKIEVEGSWWLRGNYMRIEGMPCEMTSWIQKSTQRCHMQSMKMIFNNNLTHLLDTFTTHISQYPTKQKQGSTILSHQNLPFSIFKTSPRLIPRNVSGSAWNVATSWWRRNTVAPVEMDGQWDLAGKDSRGLRWNDGI